jgi:hypothetical protein
MLGRIIALLVLLAVGLAVFCVSALSMEKPNETSENITAESEENGAEEPACEPGEYQDGAPKVPGFGIGMSLITMAGASLLIMRLKC